MLTYISLFLGIGSVVPLSLFRNNLCALVNIHIDTLPLQRGCNVKVISIQETILFQMVENVIVFAAPPFLVIGHAIDQLPILKDK
jgi:hypothetical protein